MIAQITIALTSEHPNNPLDTVAVFANSAATFSIAGVPSVPAIAISAVAVSVTNASGATATVNAVRGEENWTATFPASHFGAAGSVSGGVAVAISGTDENGAARTWIAGVGSIVVLSASPMPEPGDVVYNLRLHDAEPDAPTDGDVWPDGDGGYLLWQDGEAHPLGGGSSITVDDELSTTSENPVQNKVVTAALAKKADLYSAWTWDAAGTTAGLGQPIYSRTDGEWLIEYERAPYVADETSESALELHFTIPFGGVAVIMVATRTRLPTMADVDAKLDKTDVVNPETATDNGKAADARITYQMLTLMDAAKENVSNKVTSLSAQSTDAQYPSAKCVYDRLAGKADATSLPYALNAVTPTAGAPFVLDACFPIKYTFEDTPNTISSVDDVVVNVNALGGYEICDPNLIPESETPVLEIAPDGKFSSAVDGVSNITFGSNEDTPDSSTQVLGFTQTAALTDRAINAVSLTADATLAFPAQTAGKARDFVVRLTLTETGNVVPSVTFPADVAYETEGGEWPDLTEAGTYIVRLTEVPKASESETARFFLQCSSAVADAEPPSAGGGQ